MATDVASLARRTTWRRAAPLGVAPDASSVAWSGARTREARGGTERGLGRGTALVDEPSGRLGGNAGVAAIGVRTNRHPELLVQRRSADQDDVVVAHPAVLQRLD